MAERSANQMSGRPFVERKDFIETAFARRMQSILIRAQRHRSWHVIGAIPGSGKSRSIKDLVARSGARKEASGRTYLPILSICAPKNHRSPQALTIELARAFGVVPKMSGSLLHAWLVQECARADVEAIVVDDTQDLSWEDFTYLKKLMDNLEALPYDRSVGLCLVTATDGENFPMKVTFNRPEMHWAQFRWRLERGGMPYCIIDGHTAVETKEILEAFERLYKDQFPDLHLHKWSGWVYDCLTNPILDFQSTKRVSMHLLTQFVTRSLRMAAAAGATDLDKTILETVANLMILRRDEVIHIDRLPPEEGEMSVGEVNHIVELPAEEIG